MDKRSKIYIAGHRGLVGSAILKNLKKKAYSNFLLRTHADLDLTDQRAVALFFEKEKPEYVFLAAAKVGGIMANNSLRAQFIYENLMIQSNVIHQSYVHGVKKLLFLGSTCIYPKQAPQPMPENCLLTGQLEYTNEPYAIAKIAGIKMCEAYNKQFGTNFISVMPTNLYGPNDNFDLKGSHVLPALLRKIYLGKCLEEGDWEAIQDDLIKRPVEGAGRKNEVNAFVEKRAKRTNSENDKITVKEGEKESEILSILEKYGIHIKNSLDFSHRRANQVQIEVWGSGKPMREFLWSEDMADACVYLMEHVGYQDLAVKSSGDNTRVPSFCNTHINIGTGQEISIRGLAELIKEVIEFNGDLVFNTSKPDGTLRKLTDPSKLHALGWKHQTDLPEGIRKIYDWYRGRKANG